MTATPPSQDPAPGRARPAGVVALSAFFALGAAISLCTAIALLFPGRALEPMWRLNPDAHAAFLAMRGWAIMLMAVVSAGCALSAIGLWQRAPWGRYLAVGLLAVNLLGDTANAIVRDDRRTLIGLPIGGALIAYLMSGRVKAAMTGGPASPGRRS